VNDNVHHSQRAQTQSRAARQPIPLGDRIALSVAEFARLVGRSATYGYRQIYAGRVKPISDAGRMLIPRSEIDRFLARAAEYNPQSKSDSGAGQNGGEK
jgi:hypothetical protein